MRFHSKGICDELLRCVVRLKYLMVRDIATLYLFGCDLVLDWVEQEAQVAGCEAKRFLGRKRKGQNEGEWGLDLLSKQLQGMCMIWT